MFDSPADLPRPTISSSTTTSGTRLTTEAAFQSASRTLLGARRPPGHWEGRLSASALSTATAISALSFYLADPNSDPAQFPRVSAQIKQGLEWMVAQQNTDGGWGDTELNYSNIATTMLVVAALHAAGKVEACDAQLLLAENYIQSAGGVEGLRKRYGKDKTFAVPILANCAMAGMVSWKEVSALPFEAACVPQRFYHWMQLPVVSYAIPALVAIGQAKFIHDPPWDPIRRMIRRASINPSLRVLEKMQPASGGYLEAVPLTSFVSMALIKSGRADHPVVKQGVHFLLESFREESEGQGSWPIDTNLATWNTTLSINALANHPQNFQRELRSDPERWTQCLDWLLACQTCEVHPFTGAAPGGWGWSDLTGAVPDADDTPGALLALKHFSDSGEFDDSHRQKIDASVDLGLKWLIKLQNRDSGWPTFCRGWGKFPFDRSGTDITAHVIRGMLAWKNDDRWPKLERAVAAGFEYLGRHQQADGSWLPLWFGNQDTADDINPCYGTAKVLMAYRDANAFHTNPAEFGLKWICENQNRDGGWGGGPSVRWTDPKLGTSSVEETALCTEVLLDHRDPQSKLAAARGIDWLNIAVETNQINQPWPIGFYFAKLWYFEKMYPTIFATSALARATKMNGAPT